MTKPTRLDPRWYAAPLLVAVVVAGAVGGSAIGSTPILKNAEAVLPEARHGPQVGDYEPDRAPPPPDHYPLVTPTGTVPVAALAVHGRLRNSRDTWWDRPDVVPLDAGYGAELSESEIDRLEDWQPRQRRAETGEAAQVVTVARGAGPREATPVRQVQAKAVAPSRRDRAEVGLASNEGWSSRATKTDESPADAAVQQEAPTEIAVLAEDAPTK